MRLFNFIKENHRVWTPPHLLCKLSAFLVANISRRRADQARNCMPLHVLRHVDTYQRVLVIEEKFGESSRQLGFSDAGRSEENKRTNWPLGIAKPCA